MASTKPKPTDARRPKAAVIAASFIVVIPARLASTRLPGKALADIAGKPMVVRVAERARASGARAVYVATDHRDIKKAVEEHGFEAIMTRREHASGTDRIAEVAKKLALRSSAIVVNVQGDEPLIEPELINGVAARLAAERGAAVATAAHPIHSAEEFLNPNAVKVVCDRAGGALYFSRSPIPHPRGWEAMDPSRKTANRRAALPQNAPLPAGLVSYRHIGIYAYRASFLAHYAGLAPAPLERFEALEQLRVLWHGYRIAVMLREDAPEAGVDTPEDLTRVRRAFARLEPAKRRPAGKK